MMKARRIISIIKNKYFIALITFIVLMLFDDQNNMFVQFDRKKQLNDLKTIQQFYQTEIEKTKKQLSDLQHNSAAIEKYARENFYMKRSNENLFIVQKSADSVKK